MGRVHRNGEFEMTRQLHDTGEEYYQDKLDGETFDIGLYEDSTDNLQDADDVASITTEPSDGNYTRQAGVSFGSADSSGDWTLTNDAQVSFDVTNTTGDVDSYFIVVNFDSDDAGDGGTAQDHLLATGALSQNYALGNLDELNLSANGIGTSLS